VTVYTIQTGLAVLRSKQEIVLWTFCGF